MHVHQHRINNILKFVDLISEDLEKKLLLADLIAKLNSLFLLNFATDLVCVCFLEGHTFDENSMYCTYSGSHWGESSRKHCQLHQTEGIADPQSNHPWPIESLSKTSSKSCEIEKIATVVNMDNAAVHNKNVFLVEGEGGTKQMPVSDSAGTYHINSRLLVGDKAVIKDLPVTLLQPVLAQAKEKRSSYPPWSDTGCTLVARLWGI
jgi:hypothetical protein